MTTPDWLSTVEARAREAQERADRATGGPWTFEHTEEEKRIVGGEPLYEGHEPFEIAGWVTDIENDVYCDDSSGACSGRGYHVKCSEHDEFNQKHSDQESTNAAFIAAARSDVPALCADLLRLVAFAREVGELPEVLAEREDACAKSWADWWSRRIRGARVVTSTAFDAGFDAGMDRVFAYLDAALATALAAQEKRP